MNAAATATLIRIESRHTKHPGCSYRGTSFDIDGDADGIMSHAAIAQARVLHERESLSDCGGGGNIGGGSRELIAIVDDGSEEYAEMPLEDFTGELPVGRLAPEDVADAAEPVWDGSNHVWPDVEPMASYAGLLGSCYGHWDAADYLANSKVGEDETAESICEAARANGVHLDTDEVEDYLSR